MDAVVEFKEHVARRQLAEADGEFAAGLGETEDPMCLGESRWKSGGETHGFRKPPGGCGGESTQFAKGVVEPLFGDEPLQDEPFGDRILDAGA